MKATLDIGFTSGHVRPHAMVNAAANARHKKRDEEMRTGLHLANPVPSNIRNDIPSKRSTRCGEMTTL